MWERACGKLPSKCRRPWRDFEHALDQRITDAAITA
jgi:hypothetical protein